MPTVLIPRVASLHSRLGDITLNKRQLAALAVAVLTSIFGSYLLLKTAMHVDLLKSSTGCGTSGDNTACNQTATGLGRFTKTANALISPMIVALFAVVPIACLAGGGMIMFGNRKGLVIIGSAIGAAVFIASIKGIVA
mgnify:CR=1 FL=1